MVVLGFAALEIGFLVLLVGMLGLSGLLGLYVIIRMIEPRGLKPFLMTLTGRQAPHRYRAPH